MAPTKRRFGQKAADYVPNENDGDVWIRGFKDPMTQIRIVPAVGENAAGDPVYGTESWETEREHYDEDLGMSYPCAERFGDCIGCNSANAKTRQRSRRYYFNALDDKGELRVYRMGLKLFKVFQSREQRALARNPKNRQPLSDRDYVINRMGKGLDTTYDPEAGEAYEVDFPADVHDIAAILTKQYEDAEAANNGEEAAEAEMPTKHRTARTAAEEDEAAEPAPARRRAKAAVEEDEEEPVAPVKKAVAKKAAAKSEPDEAGDVPSITTLEEAEDLSTAEIKAWLDQRDAEYPSRASRARLIKQVAAELEEEIPF